MAFEPTTWRWPDSTFGPQKKVPFNDDQQYPDCGPSSRSYVSEDILFGLEKVITPLLLSLLQQTKTIDKSYNQTLTNAEQPLDNQECIEVTIYLLSSEANANVKINGGETIVLEKGYSMTIKTDNANKIRAWQPGGENDILYFIVRTLIP